MPLSITKNSKSLLQDWRDERAIRVVKTISGVGLILSILATSIDYFFKMPTLVLDGDAVLLLGFAISYLMSRKEDHIKRRAWPFLYAGVWIATFTSLMTTGGINSPFIGSYITLLFVGGLIVQSQVKPLWIVMFAVANLVFWFLAELFRPGQFGTVPPVYFNFLINSIVVAALLVYVSEFLKTESSLAEEIVRRYQELEAARASVLREEAANAAKSAFLANISHELRTPLGAILGYAELIQEPESDAVKRAEFADTILRNGHQLAKLVDDLLDLSKVEAGKIEIETLSFKPTQLFDDVIELLKLPAQKKSLNLKVIFRDQVPKDLISDPTRIKQILLNVIGNAIKFTEKGEVIIRVYFQSERSQLKVEIQDSGKGLNMEEQTRLFKPFSQADATVTRRFGGTGLGLSLSRHLARLLGGDLQLDWSQPGIGSQFVLLLPVKLGTQHVSENSGVALHKSSLVPQVLLGVRILLVDDTADNQKLVSLFLNKTGAEVDLANDGVEAIQKAMQNEYDLILMDVQMPVMDGLQAATILRQKSFQKPIIALTAHAMKEDRERCLAAGFDDYLAKPIDRQLLVSKLTSIMNLRDESPETPVPTLP